MRQQRTGDSSDESAWTTPIDPSRTKSPRYDLSDTNAPGRGHQNRIGTLQTHAVFVGRGERERHVHGVTLLAVAGYLAGPFLGFDRLVLS